MTATLSYWRPGQQYAVVLCSYSFTQATGARGRVTERVRYGLLELVLNVPAGDQPLPGVATPEWPRFIFLASKFTRSADFGKYITDVTCQHKSW